MLISQLFNKIGVHGNSVNGVHYAFNISRMVTISGYQILFLVAMSDVPQGSPSGLLFYPDDSKILLQISNNTSTTIYGLILDNKINFSSHIDCRVSKCNKLI